MIVPCGYFVALPVRAAVGVIRHVARGIGRPLHHAHHVWHHAVVRRWVEVGCHVAPKAGASLIPIGLGMLPPAGVFWPPGGAIDEGPPAIVQSPPSGEAVLPPDFLRHLPIGPISSGPISLGPISLGPIALGPISGPIGGSPPEEESLPPLSGPLSVPVVLPHVPAPEPSSGALLVAGLVGLWAWRRP